MSLQEVAVADIRAVIAMNPITVTRANASTFTAGPGPQTDEREFFIGSTLHQVDGTLLCVASDVSALSPKDKITVRGREVRIMPIQIDQLGAGAILTFGSVSKR